MLTTHKHGNTMCGDWLVKMEGSERRRISGIEKKEGKRKLCEHRAHLCLPYPSLLILLSTSIYLYYLLYHAAVPAHLTCLLAAHTLPHHLLPFIKGKRKDRDLEDLPCLSFFSWVCSACLDGMLLLEEDGWDMAICHGWYLASSSLWPVQIKTRQATGGNI